ncbi:MAG: hypothetical protein HQK89_10675 [Nitrospirae bacterium]|nr:hypothetical protein [Nitrospirota bacterium]
MTTKIKLYLLLSMFAAVQCLLIVYAHTAGTGYLGMSLPAGFVAFSGTSPWNTPLPANPTIDPNSSSMISTLTKKINTINGNFVKWTVPLFVIDSQAAPKVTVTGSGPFDPAVDPNGTGIATGIPIPVGVWPDPSTDGHMLLVDPVAKKSWDFSRAQLTATGWVASTIAVWDLTGPGYRTAFTGNYWWKYGSRGSGFPLIAGLIRPEEIAAGVINHALIFAGPINRLGLTSGGKTQLCSPSASRTDGTMYGSQYLLEGARLQLDPALNLDTLNLSPATKIIAKAMQKYGMFNGDNASDISIYFENLGADGGAWKNYNFFSDLSKIPVGKFRVISCNVIQK